MRVEPCPPICKFNWTVFHHQLDVALAHMIEEQDVRPRTTTLLEFVRYSNAKKQIAESDRTED